VWRPAHCRPARWTGETASARPGIEGSRPSGEPPHRYVFTVYALSQPRADQLKSGATLDQLVQAINGYVLADGSLSGTFGR
jgi:phosphatidylethanolamine-binding protein (PEBP) family uncharacterized protein